MTAARKLDDRPALTVAEVARLLSVSDDTVRDLIKRGELVAYKIARVLERLTERDARTTRGKGGHGSEPRNRGAALAVRALYVTGLRIAAPFDRCTRRVYKTTLARTLPRSVVGSTETQRLTCNRPQETCGKLKKSIEILARGTPLG